MVERVCLDAGVVVKLFVPEEGRDRAKALFGRIQHVGAEIVAPAFMAAEVLSILRRKMARGEIEAEEGEACAAEFLVLLAGIDQLSAPRLYERACALAGSLGLPTVYDAAYLAVAEAEGAEFWTTDRKLCESTAALSLGWVRLL